MIKCNMGMVNIEGSKVLLRAELSTLIYSLKKNDVLSEDEIKYCVDSALSTTEKDLDDISSDIEDKLDKILKILKED